MHCQATPPWSQTRPCWIHHTAVSVTSLSTLLTFVAFSAFLVFNIHDHFYRSSSFSVIYVKYINISNVMFMYVSLKAAVITVHLRFTETTWHFSHLATNDSKLISHHFQIFTSEAKNWPFSTNVHQLNSSKIPLQLNHDVPVLSRLSLHCFPVFMIKYCIIVIWY